MTAAVEVFVRDLTQELGADAVATDATTLTRYGETTLPGGAREPSCVVSGRSTDRSRRPCRARCR